MKMTLGMALAARKGGHNKVSAMQPKKMKGKSLVKRKASMLKRAKGKL